MAESFLPSCETFSLYESGVETPSKAWTHITYSKPDFVCISSPLLLPCFSLFSCCSSCCCCNYQPGTDLQLWSLPSLHQKSGLVRPSVIPLSKKDLAEALKWLIGFQSCCHEISWAGNTQRVHSSPGGKQGWVDPMSPGNGGVQVPVCPDQEPKFNSILGWKGWAVSLAFVLLKISLAQGCRHLAREEVKPWFG